MNTASLFETAIALMIRAAPRPIAVTQPDGTFKYACDATSGVFPRDSQFVNAYDQNRLQVEHLASFGTPEKFDTLIIDSIPKDIQEVRPRRVGARIISYRLIVQGDSLGVP